MIEIRARHERLPWNHFITASSREKEDSNRPADRNRGALARNPADAKASGSASILTTSLQDKSREEKRLMIRRCENCRAFRALWETKTAERLPSKPCMATARAAGAVTGGCSRLKLICEIRSRSTQSSNTKSAVEVVRRQGQQYGMKQLTKVQKPQLK